MKEILIALCAVLAVSTAKVIIQRSQIATEKLGGPHNLGLEECTWGPSYWCENIKTAAGCHATKHCIKHVWENIKVPEDHDDVCNICKDMVQQARDQLESNQTMNDLKSVFEGSCMLIHIKPVVKECIKLVDQFIPDLVETLASQMNPSVVCSVAGLCNSAHIDKLLAEYKESTKVDDTKSHSLENDELEPDECSKCYTVATHMEYRMNNTSKDNVAQQMLYACGELGSFSDACMSIVLTHFDTIYSHMQHNFNAPNICHLSGQCVGKFHLHEDGTNQAPKVEVRPLSSVGMVEVGDDLPCKLCEQLVGHLRDLLVANTTEAEFQQVLDGLCKQTKSFATECTAIVDEYYPQIYEFLTKRLNSNAVCQMSGICPAPGKPIQDGPIWPLVPPKQTEIGLRIFKDVKKSEQLKKPETEKSEAEEMQLPIERMGPVSILQGQAIVNGKDACALCEYVLHYVQEAITNPSTEEKLKEVIGKVCSKIPNSLQGECSEFVDNYGDAVVAILAQEIDPSQVCPMLHICPSEELMAVWKSVPKDYLLEEKKDKPSCPLCLLAMTQIYNVIKNNKTEANIEAELDKLCIHLPKSLNEECTDLVKGYSKELIELLLADLTPQEVCAYIKLCDVTKDVSPPSTFLTNKEGEIMTNEIPNYPLHPVKEPKVEADVTCVVCEFAMEHIDKAIGNKKTRDRIEKVVHGVCNHLPKTISKECNEFVDNYAEVVIDILSQDVTPQEVCSMIGLCKINMAHVQESVAECALCQGIITTIGKLLDNPKIDADVEDAVAKVCKYLPAGKQHKCVMMIEIYGQSIINLLKRHEDPQKVCSKMALCSTNDYLALILNTSRTRRSYQHNLGTKRCTWGESYWCSSNETAHECKAVDYCKESVWKAQSAPEHKQITLSDNSPK